MVLALPTRAVPVRFGSGALVVIGAAIIGVVTVQQTAVAAALAVLPILVVLVARPIVLAVLAVALLAAPVDVAKGVGVQVSPTDLLLLVAAVLLLLTATLTGSWPTRLALRPLTPFITIYSVVLLVALLENPSGHSLINTLQRLQLVVIPALVGAHLLSGRARTVALTLYVLLATGVALAFNAGVLPNSFELQKNPVGQYAAGGILLVLGVTIGRGWRLLLLVPLSYALIDTGSRGSLVGLVVGVAVLLLTRPGLSRVRLLAVLVPAALALGAVFATLPSDDRSRLTTYTDTTAGAGTSGQYTIKVRDGFRSDAYRIAREHPLDGLGIGNYVDGTSMQFRTTDPHNVLLLEVGEGGYPLLAGYVLLMAGTAVVLARRRHLTPLAPLALAVQASIVTHGMFDVYWVRGTPELGWLLVGAALAESQRVSQRAKETRQLARV